LAVSEKIGRKHVVPVVVSIVVAIIVVTAAISLQKLGPRMVVAGNSKNVAITWNSSVNNGSYGPTAVITGRVTSFFQVLNDNMTNSSLALSATLVTTGQAGANNQMFYQFYTNITGNISPVFRPDYIVLTVNDHGNNTDPVYSADPLTSFSRHPGSGSNVSPLTDNGSIPFGYYYNNSFVGNGSLSFAAKLLNVSSAGNAVYRFYFRGMTEVILPMANRTTINTFHLYAMLKGLSKVVTCEITFMITTV
jgi:hypothetical protein